MKKTIKFFALFLTFILLFASFTYGITTSKTHFEVVDKSVCEIVFGENGAFKKQIISYDENSVTLQLDVANTAEDEIEKTVTEVFLVIDNSLSLRDVVGDVTRKDLIYNSSKELATKLYTADSEFKIGVISFSSCSDLTKEGTIDDATLIHPLTTDNNEILNAIESINETQFGSRTNIEAGLELANRNFSGTADKEYIILISDGVPNNDIHGNTLEYSDTVLGNTKAKLLELHDKGINIISVLAGVSSSIEPTVGLTFEQLAEKVFGTEENPTTGKYYFIKDSDIKTIIENNVFNDINVVIPTGMTNVTIKDYFPQEIIDNFDFEYVKQPTLGTVSTEIDKTTNSITWTIPILQAHDYDFLQYKLTLKDNYSKDILDKILPTNEKVDITDNEGDDVTSTVSPKVRVTEDVTVIPEPELPKTGTSNVIFIAISIVSILVIYQFIKYKKI